MGTGKNPMSGELHAMKQRMDMLYQRNFSQTPDGAEEHPESTMSGKFFEPPMDVWDTGSEWLILVDLPGVSQEEFHVELIEDRLVIRGNRKAVPERASTAAAPPERPEGAFSRTVVLPADIQAEAIQAELKDGVLTVTISRDSTPPSGSQHVQVRPG